MYFEASNVLFLFILLPLILWVLKRSQKRTLRIAALYKSLPPRAWYFNLKLFLASVFISSLIFIGARPYTESSQSGSFLFLVDVSRSMDARLSCGDLSFLDRAKKIMRDVLENMPEARFGIFVFDRFAFPVTQMTNDFDYLNEVIDDGIHIGMTFEATKTELANALNVISEKKNRLPEIYGNVKQLILLSDGFISGDYRRRLTGPLTQLRNSSINVMAVGIGNTGETPIMAMERNQCIDKQIEMDGEVVLIQLRDDVLKFIANESQGEYFSELDTESLITTLREALEPNENEEESSLGKHRNDISSLFLYIATLSLFGFIIISANLHNPRNKRGPPE